MKLIGLLSSIALLTLGAFVLELSFNPHALGLDAVSASARIGLAGRRGNPALHFSWMGPAALAMTNGRPAHPAAAPLRTAGLFPATPVSS